MRIAGAETTSLTGTVRCGTGSMALGFGGARRREVTNELELLFCFVFFSFFVHIFFLPFQSFSNFNWKCGFRILEIATEKSSFNFFKFRA